MRRYCYHFTDKEIHIGSLTCSVLHCLVNRELTSSHYSMLIIFLPLKCKGLKFTKCLTMIMSLSNTIKIQLTELADMGRAMPRI